MLTYQIRSRSALETAIREQGIPIVGSAGYEASLQLRFDGSATDQQIADAMALASGWDWSEAAQATRDAAQDRTDAKEEFNADELARAIVLTAIDEINAMRAWVTQFKAAVAASGSLSDMKNRIAALPNMPARTDAQAKTAVLNKLDGNL